MGNQESGSFQTPLALEWDKREIGNMIRSKSIAPIEKPSETKRSDLFVECPICMLFFRKGTNKCVRCRYSVCTQCLLQIRKPPSTDDNANISHCPFCQNSPYDTIFIKVKVPKKLKKEERKEKKKRRKSSIFGLRKGGKHVDENKKEIKNLSLKKMNLMLEEQKKMLQYFNTLREQKHQIATQRRKLSDTGSPIGPRQIRVPKARHTSSIAKIKKKSRSQSVPKKTREKKKPPELLKVKERKRKCSSPLILRKEMKRPLKDSIGSSLRSHLPVKITKGGSIRPRRRSEIPKKFKNYVPSGIDYEDVVECEEIMLKRARNDSLRKKKKETSTKSEGTPYDENEMRRTIRLVMYGTLKNMKVKEIRRMKEEARKNAATSKENTPKKKIKKKKKKKKFIKIEEEISDSSSSSSDIFQFSTTSTSEKESEESDDDDESSTSLSYSSTEEETVSSSSTSSSSSEEDVKIPKKKKVVKKRRIVRRRIIKKKKRVLLSEEEPPPPIPPIQRKRKKSNEKETSPSTTITLPPPPPPKSLSPEPTNKKRRKSKNADMRTTRLIIAKPKKKIEEEKEPPPPVIPTEKKAKKKRRKSKRLKNVDMRTTRLMKHNQPIKRTETTESEDDEVILFQRKLSLKNLEGSQQEQETKKSSQLDEGEEITLFEKKLSWKEQEEDEDVILFKKKLSLKEDVKEIQDILDITRKYVKKKEEQSMMQGKDSTQERKGQFKIPCNEVIRVEHEISIGNIDLSQVFAEEGEGDIEVLFKK